MSRATKAQRYRREHEDGDPKGEVRPCVPDGTKCARGCGATLKTTNDRYMHVCDLQGTSRRALRGDRWERSSVA